MARPIPVVPLRGTEESPLIPFNLYLLCWWVALVIGWRLGMYSRGSRILIQLMREDMAFDSDPLYVEVQAAAPLRKRTRNRFARLMVNDLKAKLGPMTKDRANELVLGREFRKLAEERGVRPSHITATFPIFLAAYFVPTTHDIDAHHWTQTSEYKASLAYRRGGWLEMLGVWMGLRPDIGPAPDLME